KTKKILIDTLHADWVEVNHIAPATRGIGAKLPRESFRICRFGRDSDKKIAGQRDLHWPA
ncbi:MAG: hypothetical protein ACPG67_02255, partial [Candidatus Puniceispirillaceae bacterium]